MAAVSARSWAARAASGHAHRRYSWLIPRASAWARAARAWRSACGGWPRAAAVKASATLIVALSWGSSLARRSASAGQHRLGGGGVAAQRRQPGPVAGEEFDVGQPVGVDGLGELGLGGVPVAEHQQRLGQVRDREREVVPGAGPAQVPGGGAGGLRRRRRGR